MEYRPNQTAYINWSMAKALFIFVTLFLIISISIRSFYTMIPIIVFAVIMYPWLKVAYKKERYVFNDQSLVRKSGSWFSDAETELIISNITHVTMKMPWLEHKFFGTGNIKIEAAGSGGTEIMLTSVDQPHQIYEQIQEKMRANGFSLTKKDLVQEEKPKTIGVVFEIMRNWGVFLIIFLYSLAPMIGLLSNPYGPLFVSLAVLVVLGFMITYSVVSYKDLKRRIYRIYGDVITYKEGFLSKNYSFIPFENITDASVNQKLSDRIFNLYDVKVSCQGSSQEIHFRNMARGELMEKNIDQLISQTVKPSIIPAVQEKEEKTEEGKETISLVQAAMERTPVIDRELLANYKMSGARAILPWVIGAFVLFPLFFPFLIISILQAVRVSATKYSFKENTVSEEFDFVNKKKKEFTLDKLTGVVISESFFDSWFKVCSVQFWSIGSAFDVRFNFVKKTEELLQTVMKKTGFQAHQQAYTVQSKYSYGDLLKAHIFAVIFNSIIILASIIAGLVFHKSFFSAAVIILILHFIHAIYESKVMKRTKIEFHGDYVYCTTGLLFKQYYYVHYEDIKDIITIRYPGSDKGNIIINVSGEHMVSGGKSQHLRSNAFSIKFIDDIASMDDFIDRILFEKKKPEELSQLREEVKTQTVHEEIVVKPDLGNVVWTITLICVFIFPLLVLYPIILICMIFVTKAFRYSIESYRVVERSGVFYKRQKSIIHSKIDHLNLKQSITHKMFKNGSVTVNTVGSSVPELIITNISNYKEFYALLKQKYESMRRSA